MYKAPKKPSSTPVAPPSLPTGIRAPSAALPFAAGSPVSGVGSTSGSKAPQSAAPLPLPTVVRDTVLPPLATSRTLAMSATLAAPPQSKTPRGSIVPIAEASPAPSSRVLRGTTLPTALLGTILESTVASDRSTSVSATADGGTLRSIYTVPADLEAAARQTMYSALKEEERILQDKWAKKKADRMAPCPADLPWVRHETHPGYRCTGGTHYVSDTMIAEGRPGMYTRRSPPPSLAYKMIPKLEDNIPPYYNGPVRPERWDSKEGTWIYPRWS